MRGVRIITILFLVAGASQQARAEDTPAPEALQAANELLTVLSPDMMAQLTGRITNAFWPAVEQKARADKIDEATIAELHQELESIELAFVNDAMKQAPPIYARHFTVAELHELTAFYRTPIGAKALHEMPQVTGEFMALMVPRLQDLQHQVGDAFNKTLHQHGYIK